MTITDPEDDGPQLDTLASLAAAGGPQPVHHGPTAAAAAEEEEIDLDPGAEERRLYFVSAEPQEAIVRAPAITTTTGCVCAPLGRRRSCRSGG